MRQDSRRFAVTLSVVGLLVSVFAGMHVRAELPFTIELKPSTWSGSAPLPELQSFASATTPDGKWLLMCGRTEGLHGFAGTGGSSSPKENFALTVMNHFVYVVDPAARKVWYRSVWHLAPDLAPTLLLTNPENVQVGNKLIIVGGYGYTANEKGMLTQPLLTVVDVKETVAAVMDPDKPIGNAIRQAAPDVFFSVTGGELLHNDGTYYLVFGQNFGGFYTPLTNGKYTFEVRSFQLEDNPSGIPKVIAKSRTGESSQEQFRRRDLNVVPAVRPSGQWGLTVYGGVFTKSFGVWMSPVYADPTGNGVTLTLDDTGFKQQMCQYATANLPIYDSIDKSMYTVLFGGISLVSYNTRLRRFQADAGIPFIDQVSCIHRDARGKSVEYLVTNDSGAPLVFPGLLGAESKLIPTSAARSLFTNECLDLGRLSGRTLVGYIFGGIEADKPNHGTTYASDQLFEVYVTPDPSPGIRVVVSE